MKRYGLLLSSIMFAACGGGAGMVASTPGTGSGKVALQISGAKSFNPQATPGKISQYVITVSGDGFEPIRTVVEGDATEATITGVPVGENRSVHVAAYNPNSQMIREGEAAAVHVPEDSVATVPLAMQAVPVITNVADGAFVPNTRLRLSIFSDPATLVKLESDSNGTTTAMTDVVEKRPTVATSAETGMASFIPETIAPGDYVLTVTDAATGRHSQTRVTVTDGKKERGAPLVSAAHAGATLGSTGITPIMIMTRVD